MVSLSAISVSSYATNYLKTFSWLPGALGPDGLEGGAAHSMKSLAVGATSGSPFLLRMAAMVRAWSSAGIFS